MKKTFRKVISAVVAFALASSFVPATFAAKADFSDVAETAAYATAVDTLVSLDIINGYEDGTFQPDNKITRAEATKIMVATLNQLDTAEGMKGVTQFKDVEAKHEWATGYINAGVQFGYINGMGNGKFAPDSDVTYAQMIKMLVSAMNYNDYATFMGGYPNGYLAIASSEGITKGVNANPNDAVTRAQVAQLVYNALNTPIVENTGMEWTSDGKLVPTITKMDGKGLYQNSQKLYKTLLTEYFDIYYVEGWVTDTEKGGQKKGEVEFVIAKTEMYENEEFDRWYNYSSILDINSNVERSTRTIARVLVGDTDATDYQGVYAGAYIQVDEYDDKKLISFVPSGKNKSVTVDADLVESYDSTNFELEVYASENATRTTSYKLSKNDAGTAVQAAVYVNGFYVGNNATAINNYVLTTNVGDVELVDTYKTDGYYDTIYVNSYATAIVSAVIPSTSDLIFKKFVSVGALLPTAQLTLDVEENEDLNYKIIYNGEEIGLEDLEEDDILSIACDVTETDIANCENLVIYVSRDVKTGKFTSKDAEEVEAVIGGETYSFIDETAGSSSILNSMALTNEYTVYVDAFGRIVKSELNTSAAKYAIVDLAIANSDGSYDGDRIRMFTADGEIKTLVMESDATVVIPTTTTTGNDTSTTYTSGQLAAIRTRVGTSAATRTPVQQRVVTYKVATKTGYIKELTFLNPDKETAQASSDYKASSEKLGSIYFSDATRVIDAIEYSEQYTLSVAGVKHTDLKVASSADLTDGVGYTAYGYSKVNGIHAFVVVTAGEASYGEKTGIAVVAGSIGETTDENGDLVYSVEVYANGGQETSTLMISEDAKVNSGTRFNANSVKVGDVIAYTNGSYGLVDDVQTLFTTTTYASTFTALADAVIHGSVTPTAPNPAKSSDAWTTLWSGETIPSGDDPIRLMVGIVADKTDRILTLAAPQSNTVDGTAYPYSTDINGNPSTGVYEIDLSDDTAVFTYDYEKRGSNRVSRGLTDSIIPTTLVDGSACYADADNEVIDWAKEQPRKNIKLAFVKTLDDEAVEILYITGKYDLNIAANYSPAPTPPVGGGGGGGSSTPPTPPTPPAEATLSFEIPTGATTLGALNFEDLGSFAISEDTITGTYTKITTPWAEFSGDTAQQLGYYFPIKFTAALQSTVTIKKFAPGGAQVGTDLVINLAEGAAESLIVFVADNSEVRMGNSIEFTVESAGATTKTYTFTLPATPSVNP